MLSTVAALFERLDDREVRYCHWKSNRQLVPAFDGQGDLDLLVDRRDAGELHAVLVELGFRPAAEPNGIVFPSVEHHIALDPESGTLVHVHAYFRVISGESLVKNYRFPVERLLLERVTRIGPAVTPTRGAELLVYALRVHLKHATLTEFALARSGWREACEEAAWLAQDGGRAEAEALRSEWLPGVGADRFGAALDALLEPAGLLRRFAVARRLRAGLRGFRRHGRARAWAAGVGDFASRGLHVLRGRRRGLSPATGGAVIAFVGPEAAGKSTLISETEAWLGTRYGVERVHAGKPPATALTVLPNALLPALRRLLPAQRSTRVSSAAASARAGAVPAARVPLLFALRSVLLAHDRRTLLTRAFRASANGRVVLCDRYPSTEIGALDGAQLRGVEGGIRGWLSGIEARLYRDVPAPDLVIALTAPLEVTLERNRSRSKVEDETYVRDRHARVEGMEFGAARVVRVATDRPLEEAVRDIRSVVWEAL